MDYISLKSLENQYPKVDNYKTDANNIVLTGNYPENTIKFAKPNLDDINWVADTSFRFILEFLDASDQIIRYTSQKYYNDLKLSLDESNPYFSLESLKDYNIVRLTVTDIIKKFEELQAVESSVKVSIKKNTFVTKDGIDYISLVKYIDWLILPVDLNQVENGGVLDWTTLIEE